MGNNKNKRLNVSTLQFLILSLAVSFVSVPLVYATCVGIRQKNLEAEAETDPESETEEETEEEVEYEYGYEFLGYETLYVPLLQMPISKI